MSSLPLRALALSVVAGVGVYVAAVLAGDLSAVWGTVRGLHGWAWVVILALSLVNYALRFARWHAYLGRLGHRVQAGSSLAYYLAGFAFTTTPGKAGEAVRSGFLKRHGGSYPESLAALFVERLLDLAAILLLAAIVTAAFQSTRWLVGLAALATLGALALVGSRTLLRLLEHPRLRLATGRVEPVRRGLVDLLASSAVLLSPGWLYGGLGLGLVGWGAEGAALFVILREIGVEVSFALAVGIYALSMLAGAVSFIPGGLGSAEAAMGLLLILSGADTPSAVTATVVCRITTLWLAVVIGLACIAWLERGAGAARA